MVGAPARRCQGHLAGALKDVEKFAGWEVKGGVLKAGGTAGAKAWRFEEVQGSRGTEAGGGGGRGRTGRLVAEQAS